MITILQVYLYWPDDDRWYRAHVEKIFFQTSSAYVHYPDDDTYEEINLKQLINDKHIAFIETKGKSTKLRQGEKPVDDDGTAVYYESEDEPDSSEDIGSDDWVNESDLDDEDDDDDELSEGADAVDKEDEMNEKATKKVPKQELSLAEQARRAQGKARPAAKKRSKSAPSRDETGPPAPEGLQPLRSKQPPPAPSRLPNSSGPSKRVEAASKSVARASSMASSINKLGSSKLTNAASLTSRGSGSLAPSDEEMRKKAKDQLIAALTLAIEEVNKRGQGEKCVDGKAPDVTQAKDVGAKIESELFSLQNELSSVYKSKFRSLIFNLKDPNNELRLRVLLGDIIPSQLVRMEAAEMASASMIAWRQKKAEEQAKSKFLSTEAAAKFSTAAAAQLAEAQTLDKQPPAIEIPQQQSEVEAGITPAAPMVEADFIVRALSGSLSPTQPVLGKRKTSDSLPSTLQASAALSSLETVAEAQETLSVRPATILVPPVAQRVTLKSIGPIEGPASLASEAFDADEDYFATTYEAGPDTDDSVEHLMPLLGSSGDSMSTSRGFRPGDEVWVGSIGGQIDHGVVSSLGCSFLCGVGDLQSMLGVSSSLEVKGTVSDAGISCSGASTLILSFFRSKWLPLKPFSRICELRARPGSQHWV